METDPLRNLEKIISSKSVENAMEARRKLTGRLGDTASGIGRRVARLAQGDERTPLLESYSQARETLKEYVGRFVVAGGSGNVPDGLNQAHAHEVVAEIGAVGILDRIRAIGIIPVASNQRYSPTEHRENLQKNANRIRKEIDGLETGITAVVMNPIMLNNDRPGGLSQQAFSGLGRGIRAFERRLDRETIYHHKDELSVVAVVSPNQASLAFGVPDDSINIGHGVVLTGVGPTPSENMWDRLPRFVETA